EPAPIPSAQYTKLPSENIAGGHIGNSPSAPAIEESRLNKQCLQKSQRRRKHQPQNAAPFSVGTRGAGGKLGVAFNPRQMIAPVAIWKMQKVAGEPSDESIDLQGLVNSIAFPVALLSVVQTDLTIGVPTGMIDPPAQIKRASRHGPCLVINRFARSFPSHDL